MNCLIYLCLIAMPVLSSAQSIIAVVSDTYFRDENESNPNCPETVHPQVLNLGNGRRKVTLTKKINFSFKDLEEKATWSTLDGCVYDSDATTMLAEKEDEATIYIYQYRRHCPNAARNQAKRYAYFFGADTHDHIFYEVTNIEPQSDSSGDWQNIEDGQAFTCSWRR